MLWRIIVTGKSAKKCSRRIRSAHVATLECVSATDLSDIKDGSRTTWLSRIRRSVVCFTIRNLPTSSTYGCDLLCRIVTLISFQRNTPQDIGSGRKPRPPSR